MAFYITGPTGSGKSAVAMALAGLTGAELVNADAYQLYRELRIITARPDPADETRVGHHLYGVLSTAETCDAGRYLHLAPPVLQSLTRSGIPALVTGGTGLYIKALTHGLQDVPEADRALRECLDPLSLDEIRARLADLDPDSAERIDPCNRRYLQRALEITLTSGQPASSLRAAWEQTPEGLQGVFLNRPRPELHQRIHQRVDAMFASGAVEEVAAVPEWSATSIKAIGVREIQDLLAGAIDEETCRERIRTASRRYAKRQTTWFRRESWLKTLEIGDKESPEMVARRIVALFPEFS